MSTEKLEKQTQVSCTKCKKRADRLLRCKNCPERRCLKCADAEESKFEKLSKSFYCEHCAREDLFQSLLKRMGSVENGEKLRQKELLYGKDPKIILSAEKVLTYDEVITFLSKLRDEGYNNLHLAVENPGQ